MAQRKIARRVTGWKANGGWSRERAGASDDMMPPNGITATGLFLASENDGDAGLLAGGFRVAQRDELGAGTKRDAGQVILQRDAAAADDGEANGVHARSNGAASMRRAEGKTILIAVPDRERSTKQGLDAGQC